jgi:hypothetical protein
VTDCRVDSLNVTGTTTGVLLVAADSSDGVLVLEFPLVDADCDCRDGCKIDEFIDPTVLGSPERCPAVERKGANGNSDENDAPFRPVSKAEPRINNTRIIVEIDVFHDDIRGPFK